MKIDHAKFINLYKSQYGALNGSQTSGLGALLSFLEQDRGVGDLRWAAYMLATVKHECANQWQPIEEYGKGQGMAYGNPVTSAAATAKLTLIATTVAVTSNSPGKQTTGT